MGFIRENIVKFVVIFAVIILVTIGFSFIITRATGGKSKNYTSMEEKVVSAAKSYASSNASVLPKKEGTLKQISVETLITSKKLKELHAIENKEVKCGGYATIEKVDDKYIFRPYIKCGSYYETTSIAKHIIKNEDLVTESDGLYLINNTYIYKGENPNNFIALGKKVYRIIEINENDELKIISTEQTEDDTPWDDRYNSEKSDKVGVNDFTKSRLKEFLNNLYNTEFFSDDDRNKIIKHDLCVGKRALNDGSMDGLAECAVKDPDQFVGILQVNEYARASVDQKCTSALNPECQNYNYLAGLLKSSISIRTMTGVLDNTYKVYYIRSGKLYQINAEQEFKVTPVVYLNKDIIYSGGDGTRENPYTIR